MYANYHTHTALCGHASGTMREYVEAAVAGGLRVLGFSDHTPQLFPDGFRDSGTRMLPSELSGYVKEFERLKSEFQGQIELHLGLEAEYYPKLFDPLIRFLDDYPIEYLIMGQHYLNNQYDGPESRKETRDPAVLRAYMAQVKEGLSTGRFLYLAHPDLIRFTGDPEFFREEAQSLCRFAVARRIPLEINFLGIRGHRHYPNPAFWEAARGEQVETVFGADAHRPKDVWDPTSLQKAQEMVKEYGLTLREEFTLT